MKDNKLYFIKEEYFKKYSNERLSKNKSQDEAGEHNRPCYYAFKENEILWMIPISSKCEKYQKLYDKAIARYKTCDAISFVYIKGNRNVALIQNMIPVSEKYIDKIYTYAGTDIPIELNDKNKREINAKARKALRFARIGKSLTLTPILELEKQILNEMNSEKSQDAAK